MQSSPGEAAVRLCQGHVTSEVTRSDSETDAKRAAIDDWTKKSRSETIEHPSWRIANYKTLKCVEMGGRYECVARARPCVLRQKAPEKKTRPGPPERATNDGRAI